MSDLDTELRGLRDELTTAIPLPDVDVLAGRARARRQLQLAVVVVVVAVALAVPLLRWLPSSTPPATPPTPPGGGHTSYLIDFADADHGYALERACNPVVAGCAFTFYGTDNGGRTWTPRELPPPVSATTGYFVATMYVLSPEEIALDQLGGQQGLTRIYSSDGGHSWHEVTRWWNPDGATAPLAPDAQLTGRCSRGSYAGSECAGIGTVKPGTGTFVSTPTQPPLGVEVFGTVAGEHDKWWAVGRSTTTGKKSLAVTTDGGRTWSANQLVSGGSGVERWSLVARNGVMYAVASDSFQLLRIWRSTDDGTSWEPTYDGSGDVPALVGTSIAAGDGTLIASDGKVTYVSRDGGRTFRRGGEATGEVSWTRAGYLRADGNRFALSTDGLHWREFTVK